jgi:hypothetical protein
VGANSSENEAAAGWVTGWLSKGNWTEQINETRRSGVDLRGRERRQGEFAVLLLHCNIAPNSRIVNRFMIQFGEETVS